MDKGLRRAPDRPTQVSLLGDLAHDHDATRPEKWFQGQGYFSARWIWDASGHLVIQSACQQVGSLEGGQGRRKLSSGSTCPSRCHPLKRAVPSHGESRETPRVPSSEKARAQPGDRSIHPGRVLVPFKDCGSPARTRPLQCQRNQSAETSLHPHSWFRVGVPSGDKSLCHDSETHPMTLLEPQAT